MRAFECHVPGLDWSTRVINAETRGKAKAQIFDAFDDAGWSVPFTAIRARDVGPARPVPPTPAELAKREADGFNAAHPVGTVVRYWRGLREGEPSGVGETYHEATVVSEHASVWIIGCSGSISLSHVEVVNA